MTKGIKALNNRGEITLCTAKNPGTGNCNHVLHQFEGMSDSEFQSQVDGYNEKLAEAEDVYSKLELGLYKEQEEKLRSAGLCEAYLVSGGSRELFKKHVIILLVLEMRFLLLIQKMSCIKSCIIIIIQKLKTTLFVILRMVEQVIMVG